MKDILLGPCGDVKIENGDLVLVADADQIRQHWLVRVRTFLAEFFMNEALGMPYFQEIFTKTITESRLQEIFKDLTLATPGVISVEGVAVADIDAQLRTISVTVEATVEGPDHATFTYTGELLPGACDVEPSAEFPTTLPGLTVWFDAQDAVATTQPAGGEVFMLNKAGTGSAAGIGANLVGSSPINGHRAVHLPNDPDTGVHLAVVDTPALLDDGFTAFVVARHAAFAGYGTIKGQALFALHGVDPVLAQEQAVSLTYLVHNGVESALSLTSRQAPGTVQNVTSDYLAGFAQPEIYISTLVSGFKQLRRNLNAQNISSPAIPSVRYMDGDGLLGAVYDTAFTPDTFLNGHLGEILVYRGRLSDNQIMALTLWLREKWSFTFSVLPGFGHGPFGHGPFGGGV